jgi:hypothetical protein
LTAKLAETITIGHFDYIDDDEGHRRRDSRNGRAN